MQLETQKLKYPTTRKEIAATLNMSRKTLLLHLKALGIPERRMLTPKDVRLIQEELMG